MNKTTKALHRKRLFWLAFKRIALFVIGICALVNIVFSFTQERFLLKPNQDPTAFEERKELDDKVYEHLAADGSILPKEQTDRQAEEVQINFQKFLSHAKPTRGVLFYLHGNMGNI